MLDQGRSAPCNASKKKEVLLAVHAQKDSILKEYKELDKVAAGIDLETKFTSILGCFLSIKNNIKKTFNQELASCIITLYHIDSVYQDHEHHLQKRTCRTNTIVSSFTPLRHIMKNVVDKALEAINTKDEYNGQVKLSAYLNSRICRAS